MPTKVKINARKVIQFLNFPKTNFFNKLIDATRVMSSAKNIIFGNVLGKEKTSDKV